MEPVIAFLVTCLLLAGLLALVLKVIAAFHHFACFLRGDSVCTSGRRPHPPGAGVISYRTSNGRSDYRFRIEQVGGEGFRVYILDHPSYGSRDTNAHATHRYSDSRGRYICWNRRLNSMEEARIVAAAWADKTEDYILSGARF